jgi:histidinol phosphatase-like enzyme (inositol monophosphatase family)
MPHFRASGQVDNKAMSGFDPVTAGDRAAELALRRLINATYPAHGIMGEEYGDENLDAEHVWVLDPIDGTRAFISGLPVWGTLIGFQSSGRATMGVMDQPFTGERYFADGQASWYFGPGGDRQIKTRACETLADAILFTTSPHIFTPQEAARYSRVEEQVRLFRYGVDCYAYALLAAGHVDLVIESGLKPYDVGALIPIIEQAGGIITNWDGGRPEAAGRIIAAGSKALHEQALAHLSGM